MLAQTRPEAEAALLLRLRSRDPNSAEGEPPGVPVRIVLPWKTTPFFSTDGDLEAAGVRVETTGEAELFLYPGDAHLFADDSLTSSTRRPRRFLSRAHALVSRPVGLTQPRPSPRRTIRFVNWPRRAPRGPLDRSPHPACRVLRAACPRPWGVHR